LFSPRLNRVSQNHPRGEPGSQDRSPDYAVLETFPNGVEAKVEDFKTEDLPNIVKDHVAAAKRALLAGFDFLEIHMAHAYVLSSFLSRSNKRTDGYGGRLDNRMKLPIEVYQAVRNLAGEGFPVGVRINGEDFVAEGNTSPKARSSPGDFLSWEQITSVSRRAVDLKMHSPRRGKSS